MLGEGKMGTSIRGEHGRKGISVLFSFRKSVIIDNFVEKINFSVKNILFKVARSFIRIIYKYFCFQQSYCGYRNIIVGD